MSILKINIVDKASLEFRLKKINKSRNCLLDEIKDHDLMSEKYKKICKYFNYVEHLLILASTITASVTISVFASLVCVPFGVIKSAVKIKICEITAEIKKYKSIIKKWKEKLDKIRKRKVKYYWSFNF